MTITTKQDIDMIKHYCEAKNLLYKVYDDGGIMVETDTIAESCFYDIDKLCIEDNKDFYKKVVKYFKDKGRRLDKKFIDSGLVKNSKGLWV